MLANFDLLGGRAQVTAASAATEKHVTGEMAVVYRPIKLMRHAPFVVAALVLGSFVGTGGDAGAQVARAVPQVAPAPAPASTPALALKPAGRFSVEKVQAHTFLPANVTGAQSDDGKPGISAVAEKKRVVRAEAVLNVGKFTEDIHNTLQNYTAGYVMQLRKNGAPVGTRYSKWARTPETGSVSWSFDTRMHVASVSKFITGVAMVKLLDAKGISLDAKVAGFLPAHWKKGPGVADITFRHLLNHRSGFPQGNSRSDYMFMKEQVEKGVAGVGAKEYANMNFGLCRILIAIINGDVNKGATFASGETTATYSNAAWDLLTIDAFRTYVQANVFTPAGVSDVGFTPPANNKGAWAFSYNGKEPWDSGDLSTMAGGAAFRLSINELMAVMNAFRRGGSIMPVARAKVVLDELLGIDWYEQTPAGRIYMKNGGWGNAVRAEHSVIFFLPDNMELAVMVNSPIGMAGSNLTSTVRSIYLNNLE